MKRHLENMMDKRSENQFDPYEGGEDPNWLWTSETQDEMAQHYAKEKEGK
jgi:hypothetical protein